MLLAHVMPLMVLGLWFGGRQPIFRNCSRLANVSSRDTGTVQCGREETEAGRDANDSLFMTRGLDLAGKRGDARVQRRERGEVDECADDLGPSLICTASHGPLGRSREIHFGLTGSRSQNRSPVENEGWGGGEWRDREGR